MADERIIAYIKQQLKNGYDINTIKSSLINYGHNPNLIDEAIHTLNHKKPSYLKIIFFIVAIVVLSLGFLLLRQIMYSENKLNVEVSSSDTYVEAGKPISLNVKATMEELPEYDITLTYNLVDENGNIVTSKKEYIEANSPSTSQILVPISAKQGRYTIETIASYKDIEQKSSFMLVINECKPKTCNQLDKQCGEWQNSCGGLINCGICSVGKTCTNGKCLITCTDLCSSGEKICATSTTYKECGDYDLNSCLEWSSLKSCLSGEICSNGECVAKCTDLCNDGEKECIGTSNYRTCGNYDSNECFEWGGSLNCQSGQICSNGECVLSCSNLCSASQKKCVGTT
ncbi:MAG TPA: hypothetical protein VJI69_03275, partial [Bacteroidia bacterium]|nr:hypothetical protein [Bacteroidia bacterium]